MSNATWSVTGVLSDFIEDSRRAEMHVTVDDGVIVMYLRLDNSDTANSVLEAARNLAGERVTATGLIEPHTDAKLRSPYFLSPSTIVTA